MSNKTLASVLGGIFLVLILALVLSNFAAFSPSTPGIIAVTQEYKSGGITINEARKDGNKIVFSINNQWSNAYFDVTFKNVDGIAVRSGDSTVLHCDGYPIWIKKGERITISCTQSEGNWFSLVQGGFNNTINPLITEVCVSYSDTQYGPNPRQTCSQLN